MKIRLDKYLADMGVGTRTETRRMVSKGQVRVNGAAVLKAEQKVETGHDEVSVNGVFVPYEEFEYYMLNKPAGIISASGDKREKTVVDLIESRRRKDLFPVGRLDRDTEGLLLITNDGALSHRLLSPRKHVDKVYYARVRGIVTADDVRRFEEGVDIGDEKHTLPARLVIQSNDESNMESEITLTIREGRFHQVKRMFQAVGKEVVYLKRIQMGSLVLDSTLRPGEYKKLDRKELEE
ncbi:MAG: rRNA pseudouridine synthase [Ruminococcus sp.]|nr:rRNA pseudouridine synthase [Ruminococcus sp.]